MRKTKNIRTFNGRRVAQMKSRRRDIVIWIMNGDWSMVRMMAPDTKRLAAGAVSCHPSTTPYNAPSMEQLILTSVREVEEWRNHVR